MEPLICSRTGQKLWVSWRLTAWDRHRSGAVSWDRAPHLWSPSLLLGRQCQNGGKWQNAQLISKNCPMWGNLPHIWYQTNRGTRVGEERRNTHRSVFSFTQRDCWVGPTHRPKALTGSFLLRSTQISWEPYVLLSQHHHQNRRHAQRNQK